MEDMEATNEELSFSFDKDADDEAMRVARDKVRASHYLRAVQRAYDDGTEGTTVFGKIKVGSDGKPFALTVALPASLKAHVPLALAAPRLRADPHHTLTPLCDAIGDAMTTLVGAQKWKEYVDAAINSPAGRMLVELIDALSVMRGHDERAGPDTAATPEEDTQLFRENLKTEETLIRVVAGFIGLTGDTNRDVPMAPTAPSVAPRVFSAMRTNADLIAKYNDFSDADTDDKKSTSHSNFIHACYDALISALDAAKNDGYTGLAMETARRTAGDKFNDAGDMEQKITSVWGTLTNEPSVKNAHPTRRFFAYFVADIITVGIASPAVALLFTEKEQKIPILLTCIIMAVPAMRELVINGNIKALESVVSKSVSWLDFKASLDDVARIMKPLYDTHYGATAFGVTTTITALISASTTYYFAEAVSAAGTGDPILGAIYYFAMILAGALLNGYLHAWLEVGISLAIHVAGRVDFLSARMKTVLVRLLGAALNVVFIPWLIRDRFSMTGAEYAWSTAAMANEAGDATLTGIGMCTAWLRRMVVKEAAVTTDASKLFVSPLAAKLINICATLIPGGAIVGAPIAAFLGPGWADFLTTNLSVVRDSIKGYEELLPRLSSLVPTASDNSATLIPGGAIEGYKELLPRLSSLIPTASDNYKFLVSGVTKTLPGLSNALSDIDLRKFISVEETSVRNIYTIEQSNVCPSVGKDGIPFKYLLRSLVDAISKIAADIPGLVSKGDNDSPDTINKIVCFLASLNSEDMLKVLAWTKDPIRRTAAGFAQSLFSNNTTASDGFNEGMRVGSLVVHSWSQATSNNTALAGIGPDVNKNVLVLLAAKVAASLPSIDKAGEYLPIGDESNYLSMLGASIAAAKEVKGLLNLGGTSVANYAGQAVGLASGMFASVFGVAIATKERTVDAWEAYKTFTLLQSGFPYLRTGWKMIFGSTSGKTHRVNPKHVLDSKGHTGADNRAVARGIAAYADTPLPIRSSKLRPIPVPTTTTGKITATDRFVATDRSVEDAIAMLFDLLPFPVELTDARITEIRRDGPDQRLIEQMDAALRAMATGDPASLPPPMADRAIIAYILDGDDALTDAVAFGLGVRREHAAEALGITIDASLLYGIMLSAPLLVAMMEAEVQ
jgi:hypothetical protein